MYEGYLVLGGNEVVNHARLQAYVDTGYAPTGLNVQVCEDCTDLPAMLGDKPYQSPLIDQAPWFESGNPDTWDFAGVQMLEMAGVSGSTRSATVTNLVGDGSAVRGLRYGGRTIACTALLIGKTGCAVEAGMSWLSQVLGGSNCTGPRPNTANACVGDELCLLSCCPAEGIEGSPIPNVRQSDDISTMRWSPTGGFYDGIQGKYEPTTLQAGVWTNRVPNPSFEEGVSRWTANDGTITRATNDWASRWGNASALFTATAATLNQYIGTDAIPVPSGAYVNARAAVGTIQTQIQARLSLRFYDAADSQVGSAFTSAWVPVNTSSYATLWQSVARPGAALTVRLRVEFQTPQSTTLPVGTGVYTDAVMVSTDATATKPVYFDGDGIDSPDTDFAWTGTPNDSTSTRTITAQASTLTGPVMECYDDAIFDFGIETLSGMVTVTAQAVNADGTTVLWTGQQVTVSGASPAVLILPEATWGDWRPRLLIQQGNPFTIEPVLNHPKFRTTEECADQLLRSYLDVTTIEGPTVVDKIGLSCGEYIYKVEWTMVAANPMILGPTEHFVTAMYAATGAGLSPLGQDFVLAPGVDVGVIDDPIINEQTDCDSEDTTVLAVFDPCCPGFLTPPSPPFVEDKCLDLPTMYDRTWIQIPKDYAPTIEDGLMSITVTNDNHNKRGLRIRVYPDPIGTGYQQGVINEAGTIRTTPEECDFCEEFFITYIPANAVWRLDGQNRRITTQPAGYDQQIVSSASVRGRGGGPFAFPVMQCNMGYLLMVDIPSAYVENCGKDCIGFTQGSAWVDVSMRRASM